MKTVRAAFARGIRLGEFTAELCLVHQMEVEIAEWGHLGHLTIWCDPLILARAATDMVYIGEDVRNDTHDS